MNTLQNKSGRLAELSAYNNVRLQSEPQYKKISCTADIRAKDYSVFYYMCNHVDENTKQQIKHCKAKWAGID